MCHLRSPRLTGNEDVTGVFAEGQASLRNLFSLESWRLILSCAISLSASVLMCHRTTRNVIYWCLFMLTNESHCLNLVLIIENSSSA